MQLFLAQVANAALDKYEKKKQDLEKLEALLERLVLRGIAQMQRYYYWYLYIYIYILYYSSHLPIYNELLVYFCWLISV